MIGRLLVVVVVVRLTVVMGRFDFLDHGVETVHVVGRVLDHPGGTVRLQQAVRSLNVTVTVAHFLLALHVVCVQVLHAVLEMVWGGRRVTVTLVVVLRTVVVAAVVVAAFVAVVTRVRGWRISEHQMSEHGGDQQYAQLKIKKCIDSISKHVR